MDEGLLQGVAEGLKSGLTSYREESDRTYRRDLERKKFQQDQQDQAERLDLLREQRETAKMNLGLKKDEEGNWIQDPESLAYKKLAMEEAKQDAFMRATLSEQQRKQYDQILNQKKLDLDAKRQQADVASKGLIQTDSGYDLSPETRAKQQADLDIKKGQLGLIGAQTMKAQADSRKIVQPRSVKAPTSDQFKTAEFAKRLDQAENVFGQLEGAGYSRASKRQGLLSYLPDFAKSSDLKSQEQAERNFVNAVLRRESGAAISPSEFNSAEKQYFPRPGDTPEVLAQKKANRDQVRASLQAASQGAYAQVPTIAMPKITKKVPKAGDIEKGYRFKGGNPDDKSNWEKAR